MSETKHPLVRQNGVMPTRKVMAGAIAGALSVAAIQMAGRLAGDLPLVGFLTDPAWRELISLLCGVAGWTLTGYMVRERGSAADANGTEHA